ncbi:MAG: uncharacterized protein H6Q69_2022 [Firmicutes bacterium]|nr:uncharacterized protein [Bacillota bacterium]
MCLYKNVKVVLVGGSPMSGKTSLATKLSARYEYNCISTDDIGEIAQTMSDINPMKNMDYHEYYIRKSVKDLCIDAWAYHQKIWPAIRRLVQIHSEWGTPIIIEGWALYPNLVSEFKNQNIKSVWLICDQGVLEDRLIKNREFWQGASNEDVMKARYLQRSIWHNEKLCSHACKIANNYIKVTRNLSEDELLEKAISILNCDETSSI